MQEYTSNLEFRIFIKRIFYINKTILREHAKLSRNDRKI